MKLTFRWPLPVRRKLIVVAYRLPDQSSHYFNELLGFRKVAPGLGFTPHIIVPRTIEPRLATPLSAEQVLDPLPHVPGTEARDTIDAMVAFADATAKLKSLHAALDAPNPRKGDIVLFPAGSPLLIFAIGLWLELRPPSRRPSVFFHILGHEILNLENKGFNSAAVLFRIACADLQTRRGHQRAFLLAENVNAASAVSRLCNRRTFLMPVPKHLATVELGAASDNLAQPIVHIHLNSRSGRMLHLLGAIIRCTLEAEPRARFVVKPTKPLSSKMRAAMELEVASLAKILPEEQEINDYLANFSKCTVVMLAYEPQAYVSNTSGVFIEAGSWGKPVVVPGGTWMAQQILAGRGAGTIFEKPEVETVVAALLKALNDSERLTALASSLASKIRDQNSCHRYLERMMLLNREEPDMEPRYEVGQEIDFADPLDCRCFMKRGWGETEDWGAWTVDQYAELRLHLPAEVEGNLVLKALVLPFLAKNRPRVAVHVSAAEQEIAQWSFEIDALHTMEPEWREATIPPTTGPLVIRFTVDSPASPLALGISDDERTLGLGFFKLSLDASGSQGGR